MKRSLTMFTVLIMTLFSPVLSQAAFAESITVNEVKQFIKTMDQYFRAKNLDAIHSALHDEFESKLAITSAKTGISQNITFKKTQYIKMLSNGFKVTKNHQFSRSNLDITIKQQDGKTVAIAQCDVQEKATQAGKNVAYTSQQRSVVTKVNGQLKLVYMDSKVTM